MTVAEILSRAGETEADVLREHAILVSLAKLSRYEAECRSFQAKHGETFESFRDRIDAMTDREDFGLDDDLIDWEYAHRACEWWRRRTEELQNAG